jgi:hypothetical protein
MLSTLFYRGLIEIMDGCLWMYRDSPQGLQMMDYCNRVQGLINFATSILRNFSRCGIRCQCRKCKNKKYLHPDVVTMHLLHKRFMEDYLYWYTHGDLFVHNESMVGSTSSTSNVHEVVNDNNNPYMNMVMDAMRMNDTTILFNSFTHIYLIFCLCFIYKMP